MSPFTTSTSPPAPGPGPHSHAAERTVQSREIVLSHCPPPGASEDGSQKGVGAVKSRFAGPLPAKIIMRIGLPETATE
jgi:hypothetical protein